MAKVTVNVGLLRTVDLFDRLRLDNETLSLDPVIVELEKRYVRLAAEAMYWREQATCRRSPAAGDIRLAPDIGPGAATRPPLKAAPPAADDWHYTDPRGCA